VRAGNKDGLFLDVTNYGPAGEFGAWIELVAGRDKAYALNENGPNFDCYAAVWESTGRPTSLLTAGASDRLVIGRIETNAPALPLASVCRLAYYDGKLRGRRWYGTTGLLEDGSGIGPSPLE